MYSIICKSSMFIFKHNKKVLTSRLLHMLSSSLKSKKLKQKPLSITNFVSKRITQYLFTPVRLIYYLEGECTKEYKRYPSSLELSEETVKEICLSENPTSPENWDNVKMEIMSRCFSLTDENFDSILMQVLLKEGKLKLAQSFMNYLKERKMEPNYVTLCKYMLLCSEKISHVGQDAILETYEKIISVLGTPVLDRKIIEFLVRGLCVTDKWRKSFDYVNQLHKSELTTLTLDALASAALRNKEYKIAWNIMNHWYKSSLSPGVSVYVEYMNFITELHREDPIQADNYFIQLSNYVRNHDIVLKQKTVVYIEEYFKRFHRCATTYAKVDRSGICSACKNKLEPCSLTKEEFSYLKNSFLQYSVKKSDIFINTTDLEFQRFYNFVEKHKPFDIVLDGLNVAYAEIVRVPNARRSFAVQLFNVVNHLSQSMNRILVLGRNHMKNWPFPIMKSIRDRSYVFYVSNISQDDPFLIYAALASGPNAKLVSLDMMRDHISRLPDPKLVHLFKKWQQSHQLYISSGENENEMILMGPLKHNIAIQGSMGRGWHVPFDNEVKREPYEELNNWLCVHKKI